MKIAPIMMAALLLSGMPLMAEDVDVDTQIEEIVQAPAQERHRLMNEFKKRLSTMNEQERAEAISKLREQTRTTTRTQERLEEGEGEQVRTQNRTQERVQHTDQMNQMQQMNRMQEAAQPRGGMQQSPMH